MDNTNKTAVVAAIWNDPARLMGGQWKQGRARWDYVAGVDQWRGRGAVSLLSKNNGDGITVLFNHGSGNAGAAVDVFAYVQERDGLANFWDALQHVAALYNVPLSLTQEQREQMDRVRLAREVFPSLREALRTNPNGEAAQYLRNTRRFDDFGDFFGELSAQSIERAKTALKLRNLAYNAADWEALGLTENRARAGFSVVIPYYRNGAIQGFLFRNTRQDNTGPKYWFSVGLKRGGYCQRLTHGEPAYIVEGEIDAVRLTQAAAVSDGAIKNVIAIGGAKPSDELAALLRSHGITSVVYVPDREHDAQGKQKTDIIAAAVAGFQSLRIDGVPVVSSLEIAELPAPDGVNLNGVKIDADSYGAEHGAEDLAGTVYFGAVPVWRWELDRLKEWEQEHRGPNGTAPAVEVQTRFNDLYTRQNPYNRGLLRREIETAENGPILAPYGITAAALDDVDEWDRGRQYNNAVKQAAADLNKAVQEQAAPETVGAIVRRLTEAQGTNTRDEWEQQLNETFADELAAIKEQPDTLGTCWEVGTVDKSNTYHKREPVEFWPADITVFCAPTSHGKTMILFQSAINAVREHKNKLFLYVSCEESKRQLTERALNVAIDIPTTPTGTDRNGAPCFITGTRKRTLKAIIRETPPPMEYRADTLDGSERFQQLKRRVLAEIDRYRDQIRPRLKFVHTEETAESITGNIRRCIRQYRAAGVEVGGVFVDYMQLLTSEARNFSRHDELKDICKALKDCAARTELPVIIAAQLNREVLRPQGGGIDGITVANIGEGADIERMAHDIYLLWQVDKTPLHLYTKTTETGNVEVNPRAVGTRSRRLFTQEAAEMGGPETAVLKYGYIYIEQMKARDGKTEGWGLFPFDGERGQIGTIDTEIMKKTI